MPASSHQEAFFPESLFGGFTDADGTVAFYSRVNSLVRPSFRVVDFGCGRGAQTEDPIEFRRGLRCFKGKVEKVIGLDVDRAGYDNPWLDEFRLLTPGEQWPLPDRSVDLIFCDSVMEHLPDPGAFFREASRVVVDGGYLCIRTPNAWSYIGLAARLVPNRHHAKVLERAQRDRKEEDVFPTLYRCNSVFALRRAMKRNGFEAIVYGFESEPRYLEFSRLAYALGVLHWKFAPGFLRAAVFAFGRLSVR